MKKWISTVLANDQYKCFYCGHTGNLEAHHIINFSAILDSYKYYNKALDYEGLMEYQPLWDVSNGVALCKACHDSFRKRLPEATIFVPPELCERVLTNAAKFVARSIDDVIDNLGLRDRLLDFGDK